VGHQAQLLQARLHHRSHWQRDVHCGKVLASARECARNDGNVCYDVGNELS